jgi:hypothetical protein
MIESPSTNPEYLMRARLSIRLFAAVLFLGSMVATQAYAQWQPNGVEVCAASTGQYRPVIVPDGSGGCVIAWRDATRNGYYAQHLNANGVPQWNADGVRITDLPAPVELVGVGDGFGGIIVAWSNGSGIWAQKVTINGTLAWGSAGFAVCSGFANSRGGVQIISDNLFSPFFGDPPPGAILAWSDSRRGITLSDVYAQSVTGNAAGRWTAGGVLVGADSSGQSQPYLVSDQTSSSFRIPKGAIIVWGREHPSQWDVYAQRLNSSGVPQWGANGIPVCAAPGNQFFSGAMAPTSSGNATMIWSDDRNGHTYDLYGNREGTAGEWATNGSPVAVVAGNKDFVVTTADGLGGAIVAWSDERADNGDIYLQHMDSGGNELWGPTGDPLVVKPNAQVEPVLVPDGTGGTFVTYVDVATDEDLYVQKADSSGIAQWDPPIPLCVAQGDQQDQAAVSDGAGGIIVAWDDFRGGAIRIYAQHVSATGGVVAAPSQVSSSIQLAAPFPNPMRGTMTESFSLPTPERVSAEVFDVQGRLVRDVAKDEPFAAGRHELHWDGLDQTHERVAAGLYLFELHAGGKALVRREMVIR